MSTPSELAIRIDSLRVEQGVTVQKLALDASMPLTTLQRRLAGDPRLTVTELYGISQALNVPVASWFEQVAA